MALLLTAHMLNTLAVAYLRILTAHFNMLTVLLTFLIVLPPSPLILSTSPILNASQIDLEQIRDNTN